jgi:hypothetical protein
MHIAATRLRNRLAGIAAAQLNTRPQDLVILFRFRFKFF